MLYVTAEWLGVDRPGLNCLSRREADGAAEEAEKPVVCCISGGGGIRAAARALHAHSVPHYLTPARAALGLGTLWQYGQIRTRPAPDPRPVKGIDRERAAALVEAARSAGPRVLDPQAGAELAAVYGLRVPPSGLASTAEEAVALAERVGNPVAGPGRWTSTITSGVSVTPNKEIVSAINARPPPEVAVIARAPAIDAPKARLIAAISSSACSATRPAASARRARKVMIAVDGDIG